MISPTYTAHQSDSQSDSQSDADIDCFKTERAVMLVMCLGMPRAGSTLQYNIARHLVAHDAAEAGRDDTALGWRPRLSAAAPELLKAVDAPHWHVVKSHLPPPPDSVLATSERVTVLYVARDLRGVAASKKRKNGLDSERILRDLDKSLVVDAAIRADPRAAAYRYERMIEDTPGTIVSIAATLGIAVTPAAVAEIARRCSIEAMLADVDSTRQRRRLRHAWARCYHALPSGLRRRLEGNSLHNPIRRFGYWPGHPDSLVQTRHISATRGASEAWRTVLTREEIEQIEQRFGAWLDRHGYARSA